GWIILLALGLVAVFRLPLRRQVKLAIVAVALIAGLAGFFVKFSDYFRRGATSVAARFDYWRAACQITRAHPVFGTGPGTFSIPYKQIRAPQSEMTRLVHNNFLEQASDSGVIGVLAFSSFIIGSLTFVCRKSNPDPVQFCVWLGLFALSSLLVVELSFYLWALAL